VLKLVLEKSHYIAHLLSSWDFKESKDMQNWTKCNHKQQSHGTLHHAGW
jgi:hypothetical protein